jgi:methylenetetrahydrofolate dehydrogenase (NADP+) / methenyltetrahydrofolate cyclohydrolase
MSSPIILNGKTLSQEIEVQLAARVKKIQAKHEGRTPILATILVGSDPASMTYVKMKGNACVRVGLSPLKVEMPEATTTEELARKIEELNKNTNVAGILLQHPVPKQIDERFCFDSIRLEKDVDGVTTQGFGRMAMGERAYGSATPQGIMTLLKHYKIQLAGKHAVVVGRSPILGKPMAAMLLNADCTVTVCHSKTKNLEEIVRLGDIVVGAVGKPKFIQASWVKDGAVVVDAGFHPGGIGDVDVEGVKDRASAYTPVPGGVGPMTIATLITQTVESAERTWK